MSLLERGRLVAWLPGRLRNFSRVAQLHLYSNSLRPTTAGNIMIDLYYAPTPNGHKITLFLEEAELAYRLIRVDIGKGEQFHPQFLAISPNNKVPAIVDHMPAGAKSTFFPLRAANRALRY